MSVYELLKYLHIALALISLLGFGLRGFVRLVQRRPLAAPLLRVGPHVSDTLLLATGVALWVLGGWPLWSWLGAKLVLIAAYVYTGVLAFRTPEPQRAVSLYTGGLVLFLAIVVVSVFKPVL
ncbi:MAG: SirB2 family protein [Wenzhouxiangella sp.]